MSEANGTNLKTARTGSEMTVFGSSDYRTPADRTISVLSEDLAEERRLPAWRTLLREYAGETTMHGVRYIARDTHIVRRLVWAFLVSGALGLFVYLGVSKALYLLSNPKGVNVEVTYEEALPFPVVTVCNENRYRLTKLFESGAYDLLVNTPPADSDNEHTMGCSHDVFLYYGGVCTIHEDMWSADVTSTTRRVCEQLCATVYGDTCSGYLYIRGTRSCVLTSDTAEQVTSHGGSLECEEWPDREYYRRARCLKIETQICDFEHELGCDLQLVSGQDTHWVVVQAKGHKIDKDNTIGSKSGHYLYLPERTIRVPERDNVLYAQGLTPLLRTDDYAQALTPFLRTDDKCVTLTYHPLGDTAAILYVIVYREDGGVHGVRTEDTSEQRSFPIGWTRLSAPLPPGIHKVGIKAEYYPGVLSGVAIDDVQIQHCSSFTERECLVSKQGVEYMGAANQTGSGKNCAPWTSVSFLGYSLDHLPDGNLSLSGNRCRLIPGLGWPTPMCYVEGDMDKPESCDIPYCACQPEYFRCTSGVCIPQSMTCDGQSDCGDNSDEMEKCSEKRDMTCDFEEMFQCGWVSSASGDESDWLRHRGPGYSENTSPQTDSSGSKLGYYMYLDSRIFTRGSRATLTSPSLSLPYGAVLTFDLHMKLLPLEDMASLSIYVTNEVALVGRLVWDSSNFRSDAWESVEVDLSSGKFNLVIVATAGTMFESDFAIDNVHVASSDYLGPTEPGMDIDYCGALNPWASQPCSLRARSTNAFFDWSLLPVTSVGLSGSPDTGCDRTLTDSSGTITSPGYPQPYPPDARCRYTVILPPGAVLLAEVLLLDLDRDTHTGQCNDMLLVPQAGSPTPDVLCDLMTVPPPLNYTGSEKWQMEFLSDPSVQTTGFFVKYNIVGPPNALVLRPRFPDDALVEDQRTPAQAMLFTHMIPANASHPCIQATAYVSRNLHVQIMYNHNGTVRSEDVYWTRTGLGLAWHRLQFVHIKPTLEPDDETFRVVVKTTDSHVDGIIGFQHLIVHEECPPFASSLPEEVCDFVNDDQCGWRDATPSGPHRWTRSHRFGDPIRQSDDKFSMSVGLLNGAQTLTLVNEISVNDSQLNMSRSKLCIRAFYNVRKLKPAAGGRPEPVDFDPNNNNKYQFVLAMYVKGETPGQTMKIMHGDKGSLSQAMETGNNLVRLVVSLPKDGMFTAEAYQLHVDHIDISQQSCGEEPTATIACEFGDSSLCGYNAAEWSHVKDTNTNNGYVMFGGANKAGRLVSPEVVLDESTELRLRWFSYRSAFQLYTQNGGAPERMYMHTNNIVVDQVITEPDGETWFQHVLCLPPGRHSLLFSAASDSDPLSEIKLDYVRLGGVCVPPEEPNDAPDENLAALQCEFGEEACGYIQYAEPPLQWTIQNKSAVLSSKSAGAGDNLYGYFFSPSVNMTGSFCLRATLEINSYVSLTVIYKLSSGSSRRQLLLSAETDRRLAHVRNVVPVDFRVSEDESFQIEVAMLSELGRSAPVVHGTEVLPGTCEETGEAVTRDTYMNFNCRFDEANICGFVQSASTESVWLRKQNSQGKIYMETCLTDEHAQLVLKFYVEPPDVVNPVDFNDTSIPIRIIETQYSQTGPTCLMFDVNSETLVMKYVLNYGTEDGEEDTREAEAYCGQPDHGPQTLIFKDIAEAPVKLTLTTIPLVLNDVPKCVQMTSLNIISGVECNCIEDNSDTTIGLGGRNVSVHPATIGYRQVLKDIGNISMEAFEQDNGHSHNDTMYSCTWHGDDCGGKNNVVEMTENGQCFSFNPRGNLSTDLTGVKYGVRMTINIESYEQVKTFQENEGIKVHLHDYKDLENVKNMGFAVAPNDHALVSCKFSSTNSLGPPHGNCSQVELQHYSGHYSKLRCLRERLIEDQYKTCGCKRPYLSGDYPTCDFLTDYECGKMIVFDSQVLLSKGEAACPDNCTISSYNTELSSGRMSSWGGEDLTAVRAAVQAKYQLAMETRHRVEETRISTFLTLAFSSASNLDDYKSYLTGIFSTGSSSRLGKVVHGVTALNELVVREIHNVLFASYDGHREEYIHELHPTLDYAEDTLSSCTRQANQFLDCYRFDGGALRCTQLLSRVDASLEELASVLDIVERAAGSVDSKSLPTVQSVAGMENFRNCSDMYTISNMKTIAADLRQTLATLDSHSAQYTVRELRDFTRFVDAQTTCLLAYHRFLGELGVWLDEVTIPSYDREISFREELQVVELFYRRMRDNVEKYLQEELSLLDIATQFTGSRNALLDQITSTVAQAQNAVNPLMTYLTLHSDVVSGALLQAFHHVTDWQFFLPANQNITQRAREAEIWRKPEVDLDNPQVLVTQLSPAQVRRVWSDNQPLQSFLLSSGSYIIKDTVRTAVDALLSEVNAVLYDIEKEAGKVAADMLALTAVLQQFKDTSVINDEFISTNFLKMDVYYGELKYERVEQYKSYDLISYFGDIGGYMGLLLGCSAITILEIVDLVVFNSCRKCAHLT